MGAKYDRWMNAIIPPEMHLSNNLREVAQAFEENSDKSPQSMDEYVKVMLALVAGGVMELEERVLRLEGVELGHVGDPPGTAK